MSINLHRNLARVVALGVVITVTSLSGFAQAGASELHPLASPPEVASVSNTVQPAKQEEPTISSAVPAPPASEQNLGADSFGGPSLGAGSQFSQNLGAAGAGSFPSGPSLGAGSQFSLNLGAAGAGSFPSGPSLGAGSQSSQHLGAAGSAGSGGSGCSIGLVPSAGSLASDEDPTGGVTPPVSDGGTPTPAPNLEGGTPASDPLDAGTAPLVDVGDAVETGATIGECATAAWVTAVCIASAGMAVEACNEVPPAVEACGNHFNEPGPDDTVQATGPNAVNKSALTLTRKKITDPGPDDLSWTLGRAVGAIASWFVRQGAHPNTDPGPDDTARANGPGALAPEAARNSHPNTDPGPDDVCGTPTKLSTPDKHHRVPGAPHR